MTRDSVAEWILSLVLPPLPAEAIAGDLNETTHSVASFWISVIKIVLRATFRQVANFPAVLLWSSLLVMRFTLAFEFLFVWIAVPYSFHFNSGFAWLVWPYSLIMSARVGQLTARRAPGKEISSWIAALLCTSIGWSITLAVRPIPFDTPVLFGLFPHPALLLPMLIGSLLARRQSLNKITQ